MNTYLSVIILTHNHLDLTKKLYESLNVLQMSNEIIFVDDRSTDGTREWVESLEPNGNTKKIKLVKKDRLRILCRILTPVRLLLQGKGNLHRLGQPNL